MSVLIATAPALRTFATNFGATENPISQGGIWTNGSLFVDGAASKTDMQTGSTGAYTTMASFDGTNYIDSVACLSGFTADHEVIGTIYNAAGGATGLEVELHLRCRITSSFIYTYEIDCIAAFNGLIQLVQWTYDFTTPNKFDILVNPVNVGMLTGDRVRARIKGTLITVDYSSQGGAFSNLFTHDISGDVNPLLVGNPGMGGWQQSGTSGTCQNMAFSSYSATDV